MTRARVVPATDLTPDDVGGQVKLRQWSRGRLRWTPHWLRLAGVVPVPRPGVPTGDAVRLVMHHDRTPEAELTMLCMSADVVKYRPRTVA